MDTLPSSAMSRPLPPYMSNLADRYSPEGHALPVFEPYDDTFYRILRCLLTRVHYRGFQSVEYHDILEYEGESFHNELPLGWNYHGAGRRFPKILIYKLYILLCNDNRTRSRVPRVVGDLKSPSARARDS